MWEWLSNLNDQSLAWGGAGLFVLVLVFLGLARTFKGSITSKTAKADRGSIASAGNVTISYAPVPPRTPAAEKKKSS